jgi:hypothetical protein
MLETIDVIRSSRVTTLRLSQPLTPSDKHFLSRLASRIQDSYSSLIPSMNRDLFYSPYDTTHPLYQLIQTLSTCRFKLDQMRYSGLRYLPQRAERLLDYFNPAREERCHGLLSEFLSMINQAVSSTLPMPTHLDIYRELLALAAHWTCLEITHRPGEGKTILCAKSDPITLECPDTGCSEDFGPFLIKLRFFSSPVKPDFETVALEPNSPEEDSNLTHPHVSDNTPCLGEMSAVFRRCLNSGLLSEAFDILDTCLHTYTRHGAYRSLDQWRSVGRCESCDSSISDSDRLYYCHSCGCTLCEDCSFYCESCNRDFCYTHIRRCSCGRYLCPDCISSCEYCGDYVCDSCATSCDNCGRTLCENCKTDEHLCPDCQEELDERRKAEEEEEDATSQEEDEVEDETEEEANQTNQAI